MTLKYIRYLWNTREGAGEIAPLCVMRLGGGRGFPGENENRCRAGRHIWRRKRALNDGFLKRIQ